VREEYQQLVVFRRSTKVSLFRYRPQELRDEGHHHDRRRRHNPRSRKYPDAFKKRLFPLGLALPNSLQSLGVESSLGLRVLENLKLGFIRCEFLSFFT
jgi:hypothetical protein